MRQQWPHVCENHPLGDWWAVTPQVETLDDTLPLRQVGLTDDVVHPTQPEVRDPLLGEENKVALLPTLRNSTRNDANHHGSCFSPGRDFLNLVLTEGALGLVTGSDDVQGSCIGVQSPL